MLEDYKCPICGEKTFKLYGNYRKDKLCANHAQDWKNNKIAILGKATYLNDEEQNDPEFDIMIFVDIKNDQVLNEFLPEQISNRLKQSYTGWPANGYNNCLICNKKSNGYAFCRECYRKCNFKELQKALLINKEHFNEYSITSQTESTK